MHRIVQEPSSTGKLEYKECCPNETCRAGRGTSWVYDKAFTNPCCKYCKTQLSGKNMMKYLFDRRKYYFGETS